MRNKILTIDKLYLLALLAVSLSFFNYMPIASYLRQNLFFFLSFFYILIRCNGYIGAIAVRSRFGKDLIWLIIGYSITIFFSIFFWNQPVLDAIFINLSNITMVFLYFYFIRINIAEEKIIKALVICTIIWTAIEWGQQLTYPSYWFCGRVDDENGIEERMGLWRFYIAGVHLAIIVLIYYLDRFVQFPEKRRYNFLMYAIAMIGIIGFVSRKQIYAAILVSILAFIMIKGKYRIFVILLLLAASVYGIRELSVLMTDLNEKTVDELTNDDFIRYVATKYFLFDFSDSPIYYLFGTGSARENTSVEQAYTYLMDMYGFYTSDCGVFGFAAHYGWVNVLLFFVPMFRIIGNWKRILLWHKLYLIYFGVMLNMAFWGNSRMGYLSFIIYLYLVDKHLQNGTYNVPKKLSSL